MLQRISAGIVLGALAITGSGCGDDDTTSHDAPISVSDARVTVDAMGAAVDARLADAGAAADATPPAADAATGDGGMAVSRERFRYEVTSITNTGPGQAPTVTFRVVDPTNGDQPWDIRTAPEFGTGASLRLHVGWPAVDFNNAGSGATAPGQPVRVELLSPPAGANFQANGDGSYTVTSTTAIPASVTGSGAVELEGHPVSAGQNVPVTTIVQFFAITDAAATPRRQVVSTAKCNGCHAVLTAHGMNRNDNVEACALCHNASATDAERANAVTPVAADDQPIDLKWLIHVIHASDIRRDDVTIYGFAPPGMPPAAHVFPIDDFPAEQSNCATCHVDETFELPLPMLAGIDAALYDTTVDANAIGDLADNTRIPANVAVCTSCHDQVSFTNTSLSNCMAGAPNPVGGCYHLFAGPTANCALCHGGGVAAHHVTMP